MPGAVRAFAWEFGWRHRWGFSAILGYFVVLAALNLVFLPVGHADDPVSSIRLAFTVNVPVCAAVFYLVAVFTHGLRGDLSARASMYPTRLFTLPVSNAALAGWPMLFGTVCVSLLWVATALIGLWPVGARLPLVWPALFLAAVLAWIQVFTWLPYGLPGLRVLAAVLWLMTADVVAILALYHHTPKPLMIALLAPQLPLAFLAARFAVARARRGDVPDWRGILTRALPRNAVHPRRHFASAARAQAWLEWGRSGRSLPALVAIVLPFELLLLRLVRDTPAVVWYTLLAILATPPFLALFAAARVRTSAPDRSDAYQLSPFLATRPLTSATLVAVRLQVALRSTLAAWLVMLVAVPLGLWLSGVGQPVLDTLRRVTGVLGTARSITLSLLLAAGLLVTTWQLLVQSLFIGLSGRAWLVRASVIGTLAALVVLGPLIDALINSAAALTALWDGLPLLAALLALLKVSAAAWIFTQLYRRRLLSDRTIVLLAGAWTLTVLALQGMLAWLLSTPVFPQYLLTLVAILAVPLARVAAAPLALDANRHR